MAIIGGASIVFLFTGCGSLSTANYPIRPLVSNKTLQDSKAPVVYIRIASTTPLQALQTRQGVKALGLETAIIDGAVEAIQTGIDAVPKVEQSWSHIRNSNAFETIEVYGAGLAEEDLKAMAELAGALRRKVP